MLYRQAQKYFVSKISNKFFYSYYAYVGSALSLFLVAALGVKNQTDSELWIYIVGFSAYNIYIDFGFTPIIQRWVTYIINGKENNVNLKELFYFSKKLYLLLGLILLVVDFYITYKFIDKQNHFLSFIAIIGLFISLRFKYGLAFLMGLNKVKEAQKIISQFTTLKLGLILVGIIFSTELIFYVCAIQIANILQSLSIKRKSQTEILSSSELVVQMGYLKRSFFLITPLVWRGGMALVLSRLWIEEIQIIILGSESSSSAESFLLRFSLYVSSFSAVWLNIQTPQIAIDRIKKAFKVSEYAKYVIIPTTILCVGLTLLVLISLTPIFSSKYGYLDFNVSIFLLLIILVDRVTGSICHVFSTLNKEPWYIFLIIQSLVYLAIRSDYIIFEQQYIPYLYTQILTLILILAYVLYNEKFKRFNLFNFI